MSVAAIATLSLTSGTTRIVSVCVSCGSDTSPASVTNAAGPPISKFSVMRSPRATFTSPVMRSKAKPSLKTSRKSSVTRRGSDWSEMSPRSFPAPGWIFANCPRRASTRKFPEKRFNANSYGNPGHTSVPLSEPLPPLM